MRVAVRILSFASLALLAFLFATRNVSELVVMDIGLLRFRTTLPLVVFVSILLGMGASSLVAWRVERRGRRSQIMHKRAAEGLRKAAIEDAPEERGAGASIS